MAEDDFDEWNGVFVIGLEAINCSGNCCFISYSSLVIDFPNKLESMSL